MSTKLENLPLELFGALSEFLLANEVCWLWLSGSKRLHYLLEHGVTSFYHFPTPRRAYLWPSFISRFTRLQTASICSVMSWNKTKLYHGVVLPDIPNSITSLKLDYANGLLSLLQPPSTNIFPADISLPAMPLSVMFPNLAHLDVSNVIGPAKDGSNVILSLEPILALPLSTLHLSLINPFPAELLKHLSPTISSLKLSSLEGDADSFPPHLMELILNNFGDSIDISVLPKTLQRLTLHCRENTVIHWRNWPNELTFLKIGHSRLQLSHSDIKSLPNTLLSLSLVVKSIAFESLHDLPQKLTYLFFNGPRAFSDASAHELAQFEPKRLPPGLTGGSMDHLVLHTSHERLNTFPSGIRLMLSPTMESLAIFTRYAPVMASHLDRLSWRSSKPEINWSFKNLKILDFGESVHPGQVYLTLPLLPLLERLDIGRYIEDPSLALNRIISPFFNHLSANCHPSSLSKWGVRLFQQVSMLRLRYDPCDAPKSDWFLHLDSDGYHLDESSRKDILAMDNPDWSDFKGFGRTRTQEDGGKAPLINWSVFASLLPRSLTYLEICNSEPMDDEGGAILTSEFAWPQRLEAIDTFVPPHLWSSLPQSLGTFNTVVETSDLIQLSQNLERLPKLLNSVCISFVHPTDVDAPLALQIFTKLLQERPHLLQLRIGFESIAIPDARKIQPIPAAIEVTFGLVPPI